MHKICSVTLIFTVLHLSLALSLSKSQVHQSSMDYRCSKLTHQKYKSTAGAETCRKSNQLKLVDNNPSHNSQTLQLAHLQVSSTFDTSKSYCEMTSSQKIKMIDQLTKARDELAKLQAKIINKSKNTTLQADITRQKSIIGNIEKLVQTKCQNANFQSNIFVGSWILGKQTIEDIVEQNFQRSRNNQNIINCPIDTPFYQGRKCIKCSQLQVFNMQTKKCQICPFDTKFNTDKHICQHIIHFTDFKTLSNYVLDAQLPSNPPVGLTACPPSDPYFNGSCMKCSLPKYWSVKDRKCKECPVNQVFNLNTKVCAVVEKQVFITNLAAIQRYLQVENYTFLNLREQLQIFSKRRKTIVCDQKTPIATPEGDKCIACNNTSYYNLKTKECIQFAFISNINALKASGKIIASELQTLKSLQLQGKALSQQKVVCPQNQPLWNGSVCIGCQNNLYYSLANKTCITPQRVTNIAYINSTKKIQQSSEITLQKMKQEISKSQLPIEYCPKEAPLFNGKQCISCSDNQYYGLQNKACLNLVYVSNPEAISIQKKSIQKQNASLNHVLIQKKLSATKSNAYPTCSPGEQVDPNTYKCSKRTVGLFQTNLEAKKLLFDGTPHAQYQEIYKENLKKYPNIQDCPLDKLYFDGFECISCPPTNPLFSMFTKRCTQCPPNTIYSQQKYCYSGKQLRTTSPSTGKMYSSIF